MTQAQEDLASLPAHSAAAINRRARQGESYETMLAALPRLCSLYFCNECLVVSISETAHRCKATMVTLTDEQKAAYAKHGVAALTDKKFVLWKDEGGVGPVTFLVEDPNIPKAFVFSPSAPPAVAPQWVSKCDAKRIAKAIGAQFREG